MGVGVWHGASTVIAQSVFLIMVLMFCIYSMSQKISPPPLRDLTFFIFFTNGWQFLIDFLHTYTFRSTLDYKFLFSYPQFWLSYAVSIFRAFVGPFPCSGMGTFYSWPGPNESLCQIWGVYIQQFLCWNIICFKWRSTCIGCLRPRSNFLVSLARCAAAFERCCHLSVTHSFRCTRH